MRALPGPADLDGDGRASRSSTCTLTVARADPATAARPHDKHDKQEKCDKYGRYDDGEERDDEERYLDGDLLDLEPALRDAVVLALPMSPLCQEDCPGLCAECGAPLADAGPDHGHDDATDPRWAAWTLRRPEPR